MLRSGNGEVHGRGLAAALGGGEELGGGDPDEILEVAPTGVALDS